METLFSLIQGGEDILALKSVNKESKAKKRNRGCIEVRILALVKRDDLTEKNHFSYGMEVEERAGDVKMSALQGSEEDTNR